MNRNIFLKIWLRAGVPILAVTVLALFAGAALVSVSIELLRCQRIGNIGTELALILSGEDLSDRAACAERLDLSAFYMVGILYDQEGREIVRSDFYQYTEDDSRRAVYREMEDMLAMAHAGKDLPGTRINPFGRNYHYDVRPVLTKQGNCTLYYAGVTGMQQRRQEKYILLIALAVLAAMAALTLCIAWSYYRIHQKQRAMEAAYSRRVNTLAHNLKTPMMVICGYSENLLADIQAEKRVHYAEQILSHVRQMNGTVEEMLEFTRS